MVHWQDCTAVSMLGLSLNKWNNFLFFISTKPQSLWRLPCKLSSAINRILMQTVCNRSNSFWVYFSCISVSFSICIRNPHSISSEPFSFIFSPPPLFLRQGTVYLRFVSNSWCSLNMTLNFSSSWFCLPSAGITGVYHHTRKRLGAKTCLQSQVRNGMPFIHQGHVLASLWSLWIVSVTETWSGSVKSQCKPVFELGRARHLMVGRAAEEIAGPKLQASECTSLQCGHAQTTLQTLLSLSRMWRFLTEEKWTQGFLLAAELSPLWSEASSWRVAWVIRGHYKSVDWSHWENPLEGKLWKGG